MTSDKRTTFFDKAFKDPQGTLALAEAPNLPIITWFAAVVLAWFASGTFETLVSVIGKGALFTWAWLELFQGVNYFRRTLGAVVLIYVVWTAVTHKNMF